MKIMNIFKPKDEKEIKYWSVRPQLKKTYGRNWRMLSQISKNTISIENVATQLENLNKKIDRLIDKENG